MGDWYVQSPDHSRDLLGRWHNRVGIVQKFAHRVTTRGMPQRTVFQLVRLADHRAFAIAFDPICAPNISTIRLATCKSNGFRSSMVTSA